MSAKVVTLDPPNTKALRARFRGSLDASTDLINLASAIDEDAAHLRDISRRIGFIRADGKEPGEFTIACLEFVAERLKETAAKYRQAKGLAGSGEE